MLWKTIQVRPYLYVADWLSIYFLGSQVVATVDMKRLDFPSLFHANCEVIIETTKSQRCTACEKHRHSLTGLKSRKSHDKSTHPSSHTSYAALRTPEIVERLHHMHKENKLLKKQISRLQQKISSAIATEGVEVDVNLHDDLKSMANDCTAEIQHSNPEGYFSVFLGEEQIKASSIVNARARRWHPVFIKWCLYLRHLSGKAYELCTWFRMCAATISNERFGITPIISPLPLGFQFRLMRCFWTLLI